jgi:hypothetical protein
VIPARLCHFLHQKQVGTRTHTNTLSFTRASPGMTQPLCQWPLPSVTAAPSSGSGSILGQSALRGYIYSFLSTSLQSV